MNEHYTNEYVDVSFKKYMSSVYGWMFLGVFITFVVAYLFGTSTYLIYALVNIPMISIILLVAQFGIVIGLGTRIMKLKPSTAKLLFIAYAIITGLTFSYMPLLFGIRSIFSAFLVTCIFFGCLAWIGHTTTMDLTKIGSICVAGIMAMLLYSLLAILFHWQLNTFIYSAIGLVLFMGITAYDTQKMKRYYMSFAHDEGMLKKISIYSALDLYLDFINIFVYVLRLIGNKD